MKLTVRLKGGKGSGHFGHAGRPGKHGGSLPGKGGSGHSSTVAHAAKSKLEHVKEHEPAITNMLKEVSSETGGEMVYLQHRLKSEKSLSRKIAADMEEKGISAEKAASDINDAVRYTILYDPDEFVDSAIVLQKDLAQDGWVEWDTKWKNFFRPGDAYDGYNTVLWNKNTGMRFELQFHTPETIKIKDIAHGFYEEFRELPAGDPKRDALFVSMQNLWTDYERPKDWQRLPGVVK